MTTKARWWNRQGVTVQKILNSAQGVPGAGKWPGPVDAQINMVTAQRPLFKQIIESGQGKHLRLHSKAWEALK